MNTLLIIDDERLARNELKRLLKRQTQWEVVAEADSVDEAVRLIRLKKPDILLLDIQLGGQQGFEVLEKLDGPLPEVIFATAYSEHAVEAFRVGAVDYLMKPVRGELLEQALERARVRIATRTNDRPLLTKEVEEVKERMLDEGGSAEAAETQEKPYKRGERIFLKDGVKGFMVQIEDILWLEAEGNYTRVYFGKQSVSVHKSLISLMGRLDSEIFFRANRQQVVNLEQVKHTETLEGCIRLTLKNDSVLEVSRRQGHHLRQKAL